MTILRSINPSTSELVGEVLETSVFELEAMVTCAHKVKSEWRKKSLAERALCLTNAASAMLDKVEELGELISAEMGRPKKQAYGEAKMVAKQLTSSVNSVVKALTPHIQEDKYTKTTFHYGALGVCAVITPWNFPVNMVQWMTIPALIAGNTVIIKPSEHTPLCTQLYIEILQRFLPEGVLQVAQGGKEIGRCLVNSDVQLIAFTGSRRAGQQILTDAAQDFKRVILELGGKDPLVVLADADVEAAAKFAAQNTFYNSGQVCVSSERIYVHHTIADVFERELVEAAESLKVIVGDQDNSSMGPMVAEFQREHVLNLIASAKDQCADVLFGHEEHPAGYVLPTVLRVDDSMDIMQQETFGPVACVRHFSEIDEVVDKINASQYGLSAVVFSKDIDVATQIALDLDVGMVGINKACYGAQDTPWVGAKQSGYGYHGGEAGHRQFSQVKIVSVPK